MDLQDINEWAHIQWPASMHNLHVSGERGIDALAFIRFDMDQSEVEQFVRDLGFVDPLSPDFWPFPSQAEAPDWWTPQHAASYSGGEVLESGLARELLIENNVGRLATAFLRTYQV